MVLTLYRRQVEFTGSFGYSWHVPFFFLFVQLVDSFTKLPCATAGKLDEIHSLIIALVFECPDLHIEGG